MKIPRWKQWLSYIAPITLEEIASEQNPELQVMLSRGRVQLLSGGAIYSWDDLYRNFSVAFEQLDLDARPVRDVLLLGLGLGSVPYILEKVFHKKYCYTAVEWDESVAYLAGKYTLPRIESAVQVVTADAEIFMELCEDQYDLLIIDIFEDEITPPQFCSEEFLLQCKKRMLPGGLLLFNRLHGDDKAVRSVTERFFVQTFKKVFESGWYIDTKGNWILCGEKTEA